MRRPGGLLPGFGSNLSSVGREDPIAPTSHNGLVVSDDSSSDGSHLEVPVPPRGPGRGRFSAATVLRMALAPPVVEIIPEGADDVACSLLHR